MAKAASKPKKMPAKSKPSGKAKAAPAARKALPKSAPKPVAKVVAKPAAKPAAKAATKPLAPKVAAKTAPVKAAPAAAKAGKWVYTFGDGKAEGKAEMLDLLGGKGANLAEMANLGLPVPPGFIISTDACRHYLSHGSVPDSLAAEVTEHLSLLEQAMGRTLGDHDDPLLVSVRSGAKFSMPGMMETVLNIGMSDFSVHGLAKQ